MAENSRYFTAIVAERSRHIDEQAALEGTATISVETGEEKVASSIEIFIHSNFADFVCYLRYLSKEDQELLLAYYVVTKTQTQLAPIHGSTQTLTSQRIRAAMQTLAAFIVLGPPTAEAMRPIFETAGLEDELSVPLCKVVEAYAKCRSFARVAEVYGLHRPSVRRAMRDAEQRLSGSGDTRERALAAYLHDLLDKASAAGTGMNARESRKQGHMYVRTSPVFDQFRIDVTHPDFDEMFGSRACL
jgi:hypothetical protein